MDAKIVNQINKNELLIKSIKSFPEFVIFVCDTGQHLLK